MNYVTSTILYVTQKIKEVNNEGTVIMEITLPGANPTNCAFDFQGELRLIVTEAERGELLSIRFTDGIHS